MKAQSPVHALIPSRKKKIFRLQGLLIALIVPGFAFSQPDNTFPAYTEENILAVLEKNGLLDAHGSKLDDGIRPKEETLDPSLYQQAMEDRTQHEALIAQLEMNASRDAYSADLAEAYLGLAGTLETLRLYEEASVTYEKALQTVRVSNGLYSLEQIPVLEALLSNAETTANWKSVDSNLHLISHIARKSFLPGDPRRTAALTRLSAWKTRASTESLLSGFRNSAQEAVNLMTSEIRLLEGLENRDETGLQLASLYLGEARAKLGLAREILERPLSDYSTGASDTITTQRCYAVRLPDGTYRQVCETVEMPNLDFYIDPSNRKYQDVSRNLVDTRKAITQAYEELNHQGEHEGEMEEKAALLAEMQLLTDNYNSFVSRNGL